MRIFKTLTVIFILISMFLACNSEIDSFLKDFPSSLSPDKKAVIYQTTFEEKGAFRISLGTWIETPFAKGGAGFFDIHLDSIEDLKFEWTSDTSIKVVYPIYAKVLRQEKQSYFAGRNIHIDYEIKKRSTP